MNHIKNGWTLLAAAVMMSSFATGQTPLMRSYTGSLDAQQTAMLQKLTEKPTTKRVRAVYIDVLSFRATAITVNPFAEVSIPLRQSNIGHTGIKLPSWTGNHPASLSSGAFVLAGKRVSGHITGLDGNFEIFPMGQDGVHAVVEHDNEAFGSCGNEGENAGTKPKNTPHDQENPRHRHEPQNEEPGGFSPFAPSLHQTESNGAECFVRVLVGYTSLAQSSTLTVFGRSMLEHISLAVLETNQGYANSNVEQRMELAYLYETDDDETTSNTDDLDAMSNDSDGKWDEMFTHRSDFKADMVCLITGGLYSGNCGRALGFDYTDPDNMFQVSEFDCATGNFTFAHEFGHNQGCRHDNDNTSTPFSYARGFNEGTNFRTIMAVCCTPTRINYWSNPDVSFQTFGATGTATRDNARALDVGDNIVSHHQTTSASLVASATIDFDHWANYFATSSVQATGQAESGSRLELKSNGVVTLLPGFHAKQGSNMRAWIEDECTGVSYAREIPIGGIAVEDNQPNSSAQAALDLATDKVASPGVTVYPNPFNRQFNLTVQLRPGSKLRIDLVDPSGRVLQQLASDKAVPSGQYETEVQIDHLASGMYYLVIESEGFQTVQKIVKSE